MVLFKLSVQPEQGGKYEFTFQYGSIQIMIYRIYLQPYQEFTFQYGSIQIVNVGQNVIIDTEIYIPIWFYSNTARYYTILACLYLHSNMVLFK